jgi:DNA end-binding protein Ku
MAARSSWSGAITFAGFPIHVRAHNLFKTTKAHSLKMLGPDKQPVRRVYLDTNSKEVEQAACGRGVEVGKGKIVPLDDAVVEAIGKAERTGALEIGSFATRETVPLHLANSHYRITPDEKIPGAAKPCNILWNGLRATGLVLVTEWVMREGSRNQLVGIAVEDGQLVAHVLPYLSDLADVPDHEYEEDEAQAAMFGQFVATQYAVGDFDHAAHEDQYGKRRAELLANAVAGKPIEVEQTEAAPAEVPDLMAAMEASLAQAKKPKPKPAAKKRAKAAA